jgi:hypothetical protein
VTVRAAQERKGKCSTFASDSLTGQVPLGTRSCRKYTGAMILVPSPMKPKLAYLQPGGRGVEVPAPNCKLALPLHATLASPWPTEYKSPLIAVKSGPCSQTTTSSGWGVSRGAGPAMQGAAHRIWQSTGNPFFGRCCKAGRATRAGAAPATAAGKPSAGEARVRAGRGGEGGRWEGGVCVRHPASPVATAQQPYMQP